MRIKRDTCGVDVIVVNDSSDGGWILLQMGDDPVDDFDGRVLMQQVDR